MKIRFTATPRSLLEAHFITESPKTGLPDFTGETDQVSIRYDTGKCTIYYGIGPAADCTAAILRSAAAKTVQIIQKIKRTEGAFFLPDLPLAPASSAQAVIEGVLLGSYRFSVYKTEKPKQIGSIEITKGVLTPTRLRKTRHLCEAVNYARDLINDNASTITPAYLAQEAKKLAASGACTVTVLDAKALHRKKLNLISAVGGGSATPPALIIMEYRGAKKSAPLTALVGKGVTFDSGGQNLKPTGSIETMRHDMAGAAAVLATFSAAVRLKPAVNLIGVIPAVHNAIGSGAFFPGDIYTSYAGKTVEIWSTDAEGRLILADAIAYCRDQYRPNRIVDLATLTGGIITALGDQVAGLFSNNDALAAQLFDAGESTGERLWRLPIYKQYSDSLKGDLGDLRNISKFKKGYASSITGAAFIQEFTGDTPWAHLDIAGTAWNEGAARGEVPQFATGFGVRLLAEFLGL
jgi:leucyl aminopeptidase